MVRAPWSQRVRGGRGNNIEVSVLWIAVVTAWLGQHCTGPGCLWLALSRWLESNLPLKAEKMQEVNNKTREGQCGTGRPSCIAWSQRRISYSNKFVLYCCLACANNAVKIFILSPPKLHFSLFLPPFHFLSSAVASPQPRTTEMLLQSAAISVLFLR